MREREQLTPFQKKVYCAVRTIPAGETRTYKWVAEKIDHPKAVRAVGTALRINPWPLKVPCHRVIRSDGNLGQYSNGGTRRKKELLKQEGALP